MTDKNTHYNPKFHQYEICWTDDKGSHGVWANTEERCLELYNEAIKL